MLDFNLFKKQLNKLISFPTVKGEKAPGAPFGYPLKEALDYFLNLAESFGLKTINYDGFGGEIYVGSGEEVGIIGHLDVVPASNGWKFPPFSLTEEKGNLFGRGVEDDKGPMLLVLFALKDLIDNGVKFNKKIRFFVGLDEENDWGDVAYIKTKTTLPEYGFSPDGNFPVTYAEKGVYKLSVKLPKSHSYDFIPCGKALNAVCDYAELKINGKINEAIANDLGLTVNENKLISKGVSAHGSSPWLGKNAIKPLLEYLNADGESGIKDLLFLFEEENFNFTTEQGKITLSPNLIEEENEGFYLNIDVRIPAPLKIDVVKEILEKTSLEFNVIEKLPPVMVEKDGWFITSILSAYKTVTKEENAKAEAMGGSTFGRAFNKGCSFGISKEGMSGNIHGDNEWINENWLKKCFEIYRQALYNIVK